MYNNDNDVCLFYIIFFIVGVIICLIFLAHSDYSNGKQSYHNLANSNFTNQLIEKKKVESQGNVDYIKTIEVINENTNKRYILYVHSVDEANSWYSIEEDNQ